jgi:Putative NADP-dependent oxidoreductases
VIKFYAARVLNDVIDRAIQVHGALGITNDSPLATMYVMARGAHLRRAGRGAPHGRRAAHPEGVRVRGRVAVQVETNRRVTMASRPEGFPQESDFTLEEVEAPSAGPGEVLVRTHWLSVDPYQRGRMSSARSYAKGLELGDVITAQAVGEVIESNDSRYEPGDFVLGQLGWQDYAVGAAACSGRFRPGSSRSSRCTSSAPPG